MFLPVDPTKLAVMAWPIFVLVGLSIWLRPDDWLHVTPANALIVASPLLLFGVGLLGRGRWGLEITPEALVQRGLWRSERFAWSRMGPVGVGWLHIMHVPAVRTITFRHPIDGPTNLAEEVTSRLGRRIPAFYGDRSAKQTAELIESWRRLYVHEV